MDYSYSNQVSELVNMTGDEIADRIFKYNPDARYDERRSWVKSLPKLIAAINDAGLGHLYITFEFPLLSNERIDAVLAGYGHDGNPLVLLIELKQWSSQGIKIIDSGCYTFFKVLASEPYLSDHPSAQVSNYEKELKRHHENVLTGNLKCASCVYMFNFETENKNLLFQGDFAGLDRSRLFTKDETQAFAEYMKSQFLSDSDREPIDLLKNGEQNITDLDMECIQKISDDPENIPLINEQNKINDLVNQSIDKLLDGRLTRNVTVYVLIFMANVPPI